jgi:hypothetical protein
MSLNTHYSGRINSAAKKLREISPNKFYEILTKYDFYDIADENNGLTDEQRAQVAPENQKRMSQLAKAISEMIHWYNASEDNGIMTNDIQEIIDKLDVRSSTNKVKIDTYADAITSAPVVGQYLSPANAAQRAAGSLNAAMMGTSDFAPDQLPPLLMGIPGLPSSIANSYKPGFLQPNWNFLYEQERVKLNKFYTTGSGGFKIGPNIDVSTGDEIYLSKIFNVSSVEKNGNTFTPVGDPVGGLSQSEFETLLLAHKRGESTTLGNTEEDNRIREFRLTEQQIRTAYYRYIDINLWKPITNKNNWLNGHWGALAHNSCPEYVKTAVCSFIWDNGMALEVDRNNTTALISYCLSIGLSYLIGYEYNVSINGIDGLDVDIDGNKIVGQQVVNGLPENKNIASTYFKFIADIILRYTISTDEDTALYNRKRRVAEANLIYSGLSLPIIEFGQDLSTLPFDHSLAGLKSSKFDKITSSGFTFFRYPNRGAPGGNYELQNPTLDDVVVKFGPNADQNNISSDTVLTIAQLASKSGVKELTITSTVRTPEDQARAMFNNLRAGNRISYRAPGAAVTAVYDKLNGTGASDTEIKKAMEEEIIRQDPRKVSRHCTEPVEWNIVDIAPSSIKPSSKSKQFERVLKENEGNSKKVSKFLGPGPALGNDPAYHLEFELSKLEKVEIFANDRLPDVEFKVTDVTLTKEGSWLAPLSQDVVLKEYEQNTQNA